MKARAIKKSLVLFCSIVLVFSMVVGLGPLQAFADDDQSDVPWQQGDFVKVSDSNTSNTTNYFSSTTMENGRLWTDKSVDASEAIIYDSSGSIIGSHTAEADEFLITLSALSEAYSINRLMDPLDAVFMVDVSGSMTYSFEGEVEGAAGNMRIDALVEALNEAVFLLMEANPENRVAVVAYGGLSGRNPRAYPILDLGRYEAPDNDYFYVSGTGSANNARFNVNAAIVGPAPLTTSVSVSGGTPTQRGIYAGAQMLMDNTDTTYTDPASGRTVTRKPVMILFTDGEPTFGWTDYKTAGVVGDDYTQKNQDWGDALVPDLGIDLLTVATASYWKQQVHDWYYGAGDTLNDVAYYTIGMYISNTHSLSVLDPAHNANDNEQYFSDNDTTYNLGNLLNVFSLPTPPAGSSIEFPVLNYQEFPTTAQSQGYPRSLASITNDGDYIRSCNYADEYFQANNAEALKEVFKTIAAQMISQMDYITEVDSGDPNFSGYLTFSDVLGEYMEFKAYEGLWFEGQQYDGLAFAEDITVLGTSSPNWDSFIAGLATQMSGETTLVSTAEAEEVVQSSMAGGSLYYNSASDFSNQIKWYADDKKNYLSPYFSADGNEAPVPDEALCIMDLYPLEGVVTSSVTGDPADLMNTCLVVLTALESGSFTDSDYGYIAGLTRDIVKGQQIVRWYVPASLIPMRTVVALSDPSEELVAEIREAEAIRAVYSVGLPESFTLADVESSYRELFTRTEPNAFGHPELLVFFSNLYHLDSDVAAAFCEISDANQYYYYQHPSGKVPLFVLDDNGEYRAAAQGDAGPFFTKSESFDLNEPGYIALRYTQVDSAIIEDDMRGGAPFILSGTEKEEAAEEHLEKEANPTGTNTHVLHRHGAGIVTYQDASTLNSETRNISTLDVSTYSVQVRELGNNGLLGIPVPLLPPVEPPPIVVPPIEVPPVDLPPTDLPPTGIPPAEVPPIGKPPTALPQAGDSIIGVLAVLMLSGAAALSFGLARKTRKSVYSPSHLRRRDLSNG